MGELSAFNKEVENMGIIEDGEKWLWTVALRKAIVAAIGFLASKQALTGLAWLQAHGIMVTFDVKQFQTQAMITGIAGFTLIHDKLKLKYPDAKWL